MSSPGTRSKRAFSDSDRPARSSCKIFRSVAWILAVSLKWVGFALTFLVRAVSGFRTGALLMPLKALRLHRFAVLILLLLPGMARSHMTGFCRLSERKFITGGKPPELRQIVSSDQYAGRTCYIGSREGAKFLRCYEKGFEVYQKMIAAYGFSPGIKLDGKAGGYLPGRVGVKAG